MIAFARTSATTEPCAYVACRPSDTELNPHGLQVGGGSSVSGFGRFARWLEAGLDREGGPESRVHRIRWAPVDKHRPAPPVGEHERVVPADFVAKYPTLLHLTDVRSWPSIESHGLLSAAEIVRRWEVPAGRAEALLTRKRPDPVLLNRPELG